MDVTDYMVVEWLIGSAAVIVALLVVIKFGYTTYKAIHRIDQMLGVDRQGRTISDRLERVEYQLFPNGGSSLADRVNQIAFDQRAIEGEMKAVKDIIGVAVEDK
jgi:hypothetical protein